MQLYCKQCHAPIPAEDINIDRAIAKCEKCDAVFSFAGQLDSARPADRWQDREIALPSRLRVEDLGDRMTITRRWRSLAAIPLLIFCAFWDGFLVFWYTMAMNEGADVMMFVFPLIHVTVGVALTYFAVAMLVNTTTIRVTPDRLVIRHAPLPWPGQRDLDPASLMQLYCVKKTHHGKNGSVHHTYRVLADTLEGKTVKLLTGLNEPEQAMYLEQKLERWLGIEDKAVTGEMVA